jgi:hypothetical protein
MGGVAMGSSLFSHIYNRGEHYKRHGGPKIFFLGPMGVSHGKCPYREKIFGLYYRPP